ncbi:MAG: hypothetical protein HZB53_13225 [Chloroflexi bacterium]|nr:hypothetical protein [Chloroflexota bacterium]
MAREQLAVDLVGYPIMELDTVFDGERPWRVNGLTADGLLRAVDAHAWTVVTSSLDPKRVVRMRPDRIDDWEYMKSVWTQSLIMKEFMDE